MRVTLDLDPLSQRADRTLIDGGQLRVRRIVRQLIEQTSQALEHGGITLQSGRQIDQLQAVSQHLQVHGRAFQ